MQKKFPYFFFSFARVFFFRVIKSFIAFSAPCAVYAKYTCVKFRSSSYKIHPNSSDIYERSYIILFFFLFIFHIIACISNGFETPFSELFTPDGILLYKFLNFSIQLKRIEKSMNILRDILRECNYQ